MKKVKKYPYLKRCFLHFFYVMDASSGSGKQKCIFIHKFTFICKSIEKFGKKRRIHKFFASTKR
jgi:hypothetical protein